MTRYEHAGGAKASSLAAGISDAATSLTGDDLSGWPTGSTGPFWVTINRGLASEERVLATSRTGNILSGLTRGLDGTSASAHVAGSLEHTISGVEIDKFDAAVERIPDDGSNVVTETTGNAAYIKVDEAPYPATKSGVVADGATDDYANLQAAVDLVEAVPRGKLLLPPGVLLASDTIVLGASGPIEVVGRGGHRGVTEIQSSKTSDPVVRIRGRSCGIQGVRLSSTSARFAATTSTGHGLFIAPDDVPFTVGSALSRVNVRDLEIVDQPTDGMHGIGTLELSEFKLVTVQDALRHGFVFDGGDVAGYTNLQVAPFIFEGIHLRALECGGQAFIVQSSATDGMFGVRLVQPEALGCGWDTSARHLGSEYQMYLKGPNLSLVTPDVEDQQYADSTTLRGNTKTARATPSKGIRNAGDNFRVTDPFFSSLTECLNWESGSGCDIIDPRIFTGTYGTSFNPAILVATGTKGLRARWSSAATTGATTVIQNRCINADIVADGIRLSGLSAAAVDWNVNHASPPTKTIASGQLISNAQRTVVAGEGAAADTLDNIRIFSGISGYAGLDMFLIRGSEDITVSHGTGNIQTASGADVTMTSTSNRILHFVYHGTNWIQVS